MTAKPTVSELGIDLARHWDPAAYAAHRDADIAGWTERRLAAAAHPGEAEFISRRLRTLPIS